MQPTPFLAKIKLALGIGLILVALVGLASYAAIGQLISSEKARIQSDDTLVRIERAAFSIKAGESALRQYLLSGQEADLEKFQRARAAVREAISSLRSANVLPEQALLEEVVAQRRVLNDKAISARRNGHEDDASAVINSDAVRQLVQRTDSVMEQARHRENLAWQKAKVQAERRARLAQWLILAGGLLFVSMLAWVVYVVNHYEQARRLAEKELRESENKSRSITEGMAEGVFTTTEHDVMLEVNSAALQLFGYEKDELLGCQVAMLIPERDRPQFKEFMEGLWTKPEPFKLAGVEMQVLRKDGSEFLASVSISDVQVGGRRLFTALVQDITERRRVSEALRASESQLRHITDTVPALIAYLDTEQRFRFHNKAYEDVLGLTFSQIHGQTLADVVGPKTYALIRDKAEEVLRGHVVRYERIQSAAQGESRSYAMQYFPRYGEGADEGKVIGFYSLGTDITDLKRIDRMKTEFVSTVSHELRTPLTSIRGSLGLISGGVAGELPDGVKTLVGIAKSNCERLIRLINDILDSEKIESGKMPLDLQVVDLRQLAQQAVVANEGFAGQHQVKLALQAGDAPLPVRIDCDRLTQVLTNLLSNAVKFSPSGGTVDVRLLRTALRVRVEVTDHGPGIPEEFRGRIFQKFSQADSSDTRQKGGSGLGLNISKGLVERMGGRIGFDSTAGVGTTFFFELSEWKDAMAGNPSMRTAERAPAEAASPLPRILVCEDDADVARLISLMLVKAGFAADTAHSAEQAIDCLARDRYDAVTVDLKMPGQSGAAFIAALRRDEKTRDLPVVVISGMAMAEEGRLRFQRPPLTVSDWLEKPIDEELLVLSVRRAINGLPGAKPRILHVEDDPDIQRIAAAIAADFATFEFAATLEEARAQLRARRFDLVLLDLTLGDESGWDLFRQIDKLEPRPPVIVFSASDADPVNGRRAEAVLVKAHTSNTDLLHTMQRLLQIPGDPGPTRPSSLS